MTRFASSYALSYAEQLRGRVLDLTPLQLDYLAVKLRRLPKRPLWLRLAERQLEASAIARAENLTTERYGTPAELERERTRP